jgi:alpha-N-acetylglucosamine transferase
MIVGLFAFWACTFLSVSWILDSVSSDRLRPSLRFFPPTPAPPNDAASLATSKEAYVLFLPSVGREDYVLSLRTLLYGYKYDHDTRDPSRDVVVLTTPQVPLEVEELLRDEGAIVSRHEVITSIPTPFDINGNHFYKDVYNKLFIWNMTQYERVLLSDSDFLMTRSLEGIWDEPESQAETGLAARFMLHSGLGTEYLNSGLMIARPNRTMFEEILLVRDFLGPLQDTEQVSDPPERSSQALIVQSLLNKYFRKDGPHPWSTLDGK